MIEALEPQIPDDTILSYGLGNAFAKQCTPIAEGFFNTVYKYGDGACIVKVPKNTIFGRFTYPELCEELELCKEYNLPIPQTEIIDVPEENTAITLSEIVPDFRNLRFSDITKEPSLRDGFLNLLRISHNMKLNDGFSVDIIGLKTFLRT